MAIKICEKCSCEYERKFPAQKYCNDCGVIAKKEAREREKIKRRTGVGSGNSPTNRGTTHPNYRNGIGMYKRVRDERFNLLNGKCERCGKDLQGASCYHWCGHHRDHNRENNSPDNIEILCKRCHQIEHKCVNNLNV